MTERKDPQFYPPIHRQSISERKAVPLLDRPRRSFLPKPMNSGGAPAKDNPGARKELKFEQADNELIGKENPGEAPSGHGPAATDFEFAKPSLPPVLKKP